MKDNHNQRTDLGTRFSIVARRWRRSLDAGLTAAGLTDATWMPLVHLEASGGGVTQKQLAKHVGIEGASLVRLLDILERQGLVERRSDENDGRARRIHLTSQGETQLRRVRASLHQTENEMLQDLTDVEIATLADSLRKIDERLKLMHGIDDDTL
jgi:MarR family transcriptional regulator, transcriptional regulator for hemolysin